MSCDALAALRTGDYEPVLQCLICRSAYDDGDHQPKFLACHHTFCKACLRTFLAQLGDEIECPLCRANFTVPAAGVAALQTNFYVKYIQTLVAGGGRTSAPGSRCASHPSNTVQTYCPTCHQSSCTDCHQGTESCAHPHQVAVATVTAESHQVLDAAFSHAQASLTGKQATVEKCISMMAEEKDDAIRRIEAATEQHIHTLNRRTTLLKNKVIDLYKENVARLETDQEEVRTALACLLSLKEYSEDKIKHGEFYEVEKGIADIDEVDQNVCEKIRPNNNHIVFEEEHGVMKYQAAVKDLGRVRFARPMSLRTEPEGFDADVSAAQLLVHTEDSEDSHRMQPLSDSGAITTISENETREAEFINGDLPDTNISRCQTSHSDLLDDVAVSIPHVTCESSDNCCKSTTVLTHNGIGKPNSLQKARSILNEAKLEESTRKQGRLNPPDRSSQAYRAGQNNMYDNLSSNTARMVNSNITSLRVEQQYYHTVYTSYDEEALRTVLQTNEQRHGGSTDENSLLSNQEISKQEMKDY